MEKFNDTEIKILKSIANMEFITADYVLAVVNELKAKNVNIRDTMKKFERNKLIQQNSFVKKGLLYAGFTVNADEIRSLLGYGNL